jgi:SnoaL-like domain
MARVWAHDEQVLCVHPGGEPLRGWDEVQASWGQIFCHTAEIQFLLSHEQVCFEVSEQPDAPRVAHVGLVENIRSPGGGDLVSVVARNSFRLVDGKWLMTAHVASPLRRT